MTAAEKAEAAELIEDDLCAQWVLSHDRGPMYWLRGRRGADGSLPSSNPSDWLTCTENYHWKEQNLPAIAPFPYKPFRDRKIDLSKLPFEHEFSEEDPPDYLDVTMGFILFSSKISPENEVWIPKTRELMTSWLVTGFITWMCQFYPAIEWLSQSETDLKAQGLIKYAGILYANQGNWQKRLHPLKKGAEEATLHQIEWANGSTFRALASGIRKMASSHPYGYMSDESAHQPNAEATINIVKPAVKQIICVSSVAPGYFWHQVAQVG